MIDKDKISAYVAEIKTAVETLKGYREIDKETFLASPLIIRDTKYSFIIAGQASIDICYHLTARLLKKAPKATAIVLNFSESQASSLKILSQRCQLWQGSEISSFIIISRWITSRCMINSKK